MCEKRGMMINTEKRKGTVQKRKKKNHFKPAWLNKVQGRGRKGRDGFAVLLHVHPRGPETQSQHWQDQDTSSESSIYCPYVFPSP